MIIHLNHDKEKIDVLVDTVDSLFIEQIHYSEAFLSKIE